jgi:hypothetical protein
MTLDDNDLLRQGRLPGDPFQDLGPVGGLGETPEEDFSPISPFSPTPPSLSDRALGGLAGDFVRLIEPQSEADPVAILAQFLVAFGNAVGRGPYFQVEADRHYMNEYVALVGQSSKGRKGTSWGHVRAILDLADPGWVRERAISGLSSGEGLIWAVRDPIHKREAVRQGGRVVDYQDVVIDEGVSDKRVLFLESELASTLRVLAREGNTLSAVLRSAWDDGHLRTTTKNSPGKATGAHISVVGHITQGELLRYLDRTELGNGFANRFLWFLVRRSKFLPEGGAVPQDELARLGLRLRGVLERARAAGALVRDADAGARWREVYAEISAGHPGLLGAVTGRAEAHVMRLACLYGLLDGSAVVRLEHLDAALALWDYAEATVAAVFGDSLGDPLADEILALLLGAPKGLTRTELRDALKDHHLTAEDIGRALLLLHGSGLATVERETGRGRPAERWCAAQGTGRKGRKGRKVEAASAGEAP